MLYFILILLFPFIFFNTHHKQSHYSNLKTAPAAAPRTAAAVCCPPPTSSAAAPTRWCSWRTCSAATRAAAPLRLVWPGKRGKVGRGWEPTTAPCHHHTVI